MSSTKFVFTAAALLGLAACASDSPTGVVSPEAVPAPSLALNGAVAQPSLRVISGNVSGEGNAVCAAVGVGGSGLKVDGNNSVANLGGYRVTVSGDKKFLSFSQVSGSNVVTAVVIKGGPNTNVYTYTPGVTNGSGLSAPNNGGNIPAVSHYVLCFGTGPAWRIEKRVLGYFNWDDHAMANYIPGNPTGVTTIQYPNQCSIIPDTRDDCVIWVEYEIVVTKIGGSISDPPVTITDDILDRCTDLFVASTEGLLCQAAEFGNVPSPTYSTSTSARFTYFVDIWNRYECGEQHTLTNTARLTFNGQVLSDDAVLLIKTGTCAPGAPLPPQQP